VIAATLESAFAFCLGCHVFNALMRIGLVPEAVCVECANLASRHARADTPAAYVGPRRRRIRGCSAACSTSPTRRRGQFPSNTMYAFQHP
jgi:hypothetical protein